MGFRWRLFFFDFSTPCSNVSNEYIFPYVFLPTFPWLNIDHQNLVFSITLRFMYVVLFIIMPSECFFFLLFDFERFRPEEYCKGSKRFYRTCNIQVSINHIFALCVRILMWFWCDFSSFRFCFRFCFYFRIVQKVPGISALNSAKLTTTEHFKMDVDTVGSRIYQVR